jgi:cyclohexadienyl dehydratase
VLLAVLTTVASCGQSQPPNPGTSSTAPPSTGTLAAIHRNNALRVCSTGDYRPFTYRDPATRTWSGIDIDMAGDMAHKLGVPLTVVPTTWATMLTDLTSGHCDVAMGGISPTPSRAAKAAFSDPYVQSGKTPITRCAEVNRFQTLAEIDQPGVRVVVNPGGTNETYDRQTLKHASIVTYPDNNTIFNELLNGHADLMLTDAPETEWQATQHPGQLCAVHPDHPFTSDPKAYMLPHGDTAFAQWVNQWLHADLTDGTYQRFSKPWTG